MHSSSLGKRFPAKKGFIKDGQQTVRKLLPVLYDAIFSPAQIVPAIGESI
jgi:hypothetical protein